MVRTSGFFCGGPSSNPGHGTVIPKPADVAKILRYVGILRWGPSSSKGFQAVVKLPKTSVICIVLLLNRCVYM